MIGCGVEGELPEDLAPQTLTFEQQSFTVGEALVVGPGTAAALNVTDQPCATYLGKADAPRFDGEEPVVFGAFEDGPFGVVTVDGDDPRMYVADRIEGDFVDIDDHRLTVHLTFTRVIRQQWKGLDFVVKSTDLRDPIVVDALLAATTCAD